MCSRGVWRALLAWLLRCVARGSNRCGRPECVEDVYRGDNVDQANAIRVPAGGNLDGMSTCNRAEDWYSVALGAGDGIRLTLDFIDDGFASHDLQFLNASERLHQPISAFNQEFLEYNVDTAGEYFIRVTAPSRGNMTCVWNLSRAVSIPLNVLRIDRVVPIGFVNQA